MIKTHFKPRALQKGDLIAVAASASPFKKDLFLVGIKKLQQLGFKVTYNSDIFSKERYLAGTDARRAQELNQHLSDPRVKAIFFARGGYGTQRILHLLDLEAAKSNPKIILGYSDLTALHSFFYKHGIGGTFYGPTVTKHFKLALAKTIDNVMAELVSNKPLGLLPSTGAKVVKNGSAEGVLVGGCLSLITSSIGTAYDLPTDGSILFLEDENEPVYRYDRMLTHLKSAGKLRDVKGIVFGSLGLSKGEKKASLNKMIKEILAEFPGPVIKDFPSGHWPFNKLFVTLPLGVRAKLGTNPIKLEIVEPALL